MKRRIIFFGGKNVGCGVLRALCEHPDVEVVLAVTQSWDDDPQRWHERLQDVAAEYGVPVLVENDPTKVSLPQADFLFVAYYDAILPAKIFSEFSDAFNLHLADTEVMRGAHPTYWAIREGHPRHGVTLHRIVEKVDAGPVVAKKEFDIDPTWTGRELYDVATREGIELVAETLPLILSGGYQTRPPGDTAAVKKKRRDFPGHEVNLPIETERQLRALIFNPFPLPWVKIGGQRYTLRRLGVTDARQLFEVKGMISSAAKRMGFDPTGLDDNAACFDERAMMTVPPVREVAVAVLGAPSASAPQAICGALRGAGVLCQQVESGVDFRNFEVAIGPTVGLEAQRRALTAIAAGCIFIATDQGPIYSLDASRDFLRLPLASCGVDRNTPSTPNFDQPNSSIAAAVALGLTSKFTGAAAGQYAAEEARRIVFADASSARIALNQLKALGRYDDGPLRAHCGRFEAATDSYMWRGERELMYALLTTLKVDGAVLEVGVGNGGTLSVIAAFANGREVHAIDDFSYSDGENQQRAVTLVLNAFPINLTTAKSRDVTWNRPLAFVHIDGGHTTIDVQADIEKFAPCVNVGGVMVVDDYGTVESQAEVRKVVDDYMLIHAVEWIAVTAGPKLGVWRKVA